MQAGDENQGCKKWLYHQLMEKNAGFFYCSHVFVFVSMKVSSSCSQTDSKSKKIEFWEKFIVESCLF